MSELLRSLMINERMSDLLKFFSLKSYFLVHLNTSDSLIPSFLKCDVSESLRLLTKND